MIDNQFQEEIRIATGELHTASHIGLLHTTPLGSCVAFIVFDASKSIGGLAHIMLPGSSHNRDENDKNKYADDAINNLLSKACKLGSSLLDLEVCLVGGANVLRKTKDNIATALITCILDDLEAKGLQVVKTSLGGFERRSATLDIATGTVYYTIGNSLKKQLYCFAA